MEFHNFPGIQSIFNFIKIHDYKLVGAYSYSNGFSKLPKTHLKSLKSSADANLILCLETKIAELSL